MADLTFEQVKVLVEHMPVAEQKRLRDWLNTPNREKSEQGVDQNMTWGERLVAKVMQFELDEADQFNIGDVDEWLRERRHTQTNRRNPGWGDE
jgi:hypothetical protein